MKLITASFCCSYCHKQLGEAIGRRFGQHCRPIQLRLGPPETSARTGSWSRLRCLIHGLPHLPLRHHRNQVRYFLQLPGPPHLPNQSQPSIHRHPKSQRHSNSGENRYQRGHWKEHVFCYHYSSVWSFC